LGSLNFYWRKARDIPKSCVLRTVSAFFPNISRNLPPKLPEKPTFWPSRFQPTHKGPLPNPASAQGFAEMGIILANGPFFKTLSFMAEYLEKSPFFSITPCLFA
jgi:hypothetical protein